MAFRFPLEAVLHFRKSVEHQQEMILRTANLKVARVRHLLEQLDDLVRQEAALRLQRLSMGTTAADLHFTLTRSDALLEQRDVFQRELLRVQELRDRQRRIFQQARQEREILESLRTRQLREYQHDASRNEQRQLDDLFLARQDYRRRGLSE